MRLQGAGVSVCVWACEYVRACLCVCICVHVCVALSLAHIQVVRLNFTGKLEDGTVFDSTCDPDFLRNKNMKDVSARACCVGVGGWVCSQCMCVFVSSHASFVFLCVCAHIVST